MTGRYTESITLTIENGSNPTYELLCIGFGTCILSEPKLDKIVDLGYILTHTLFRKEIKFTNKGKKRHSIFWSRSRTGKDKFRKSVIP